MRDTDRIDKFCDELKIQWKKVPDWRFMQLINNLQRAAQSDMFYTEEDDFMHLLNSFLEGVK